ncbi:polyphosphate kinase 1 [Leptolyngbya sp. AN02str]|uniref:polyphosphate kinase 1 n=1 Tax=Leptolyngbya sp. AN02str TaxID=3423363 RepID=UPI003D31F634
MPRIKPRTKKPVEDILLTDPQYYFNRELSWIEFNARVLQEGMNPRTPLLERLKFLAIFSHNLDEYFMVRVAGLKQQVEAGVHRRSPDGRTPSEQLQDIRDRLLPLIAKQHHHFQASLRPQLAKHGIYISNYETLQSEQRAYLRRYFEEHLFPVLTPLAVDPSHPFPYISNLSLNLAVVVRDPDSQHENFARVKVPSLLPRFVPLPVALWVLPNGRTATWVGVPIEQVVAHNLETLFPGMQIQACYPFRITRNADLDVEEDEAGDLLQAIEQELRKRRYGGSVVRLEVQSSMPDAMRQTLIEEMGIGQDDVYDIEGLLSLGHVMSLVDLPRSDLRDPPWSPVAHPRLRRLSDSSMAFRGEGEDDFFAVIRRQDVLLHHPYQSFSSSVQRFIHQAAHDPNVLTIKMTLYRTSGDSPIVESLIAAAENGKQVAVLVELKARFDEANNISWARKLEEAGVHVVYGLVGLKTHTKLVLVVRQEENQIRRYVHIGTGNYNPKTARLYTDVGLLSCRDALGADLTDLFNFLTGYSRQQTYRKLMVAPVNLRDRLLALIQREAQHSREGKHARIVAKLNALVEPGIIRALYEASQAGVEIDLVVRGMCCLRPGVKGVSDRIRVISVVGRFLEHSRILYFHNGGQEEVYIGSADWMPRNLDRRVEVMTPVEDEQLAKDLQEILGILLADNYNAWELKPDGRYVQRRAHGRSSVLKAQSVLMELAAKQSDSGANRS